MPLAFLQLPEMERLDYIREAAARRGLDPVIVEKDFWVCWLLRLLFRSRFADHLVFKGGTSLSKIFGVIDRFSEDIDLSVAPEFLQLGPPGESRTQSGKWMKQAEAACVALARDRITPELEALAVPLLGLRPDGWFHYQTDDASRSQVIYFHYPSLLAPGLDYIRRSVKLELGSLTDQQPRGRHALQPWLAEEFPRDFTDWQCDVVALEVERSFWEKATILHAEHHRSGAMPPRYSRHYADLAALARHPSCARAVADAALRERVVEWKSHFFATAWARYDLARPGTFQLLPTATQQVELERDYRGMRDMYLREPLPLAEILKILHELQARINAGP